MLKELLKNQNLILASGSPRRQQFFKDLDLDFEIRLKEVEEVYASDLKREAITNYLSELKAAAFDNELNENEILITSDTLVWHQNKALGKPLNYEDAFQMLLSLSNETHEVITSVTFSTSKFKKTIFEVTKVTFNPLSNEQIHYYLTHFKPFDKAGSYGIQDWIGLVGVSKIEGSYANVMGLPVDKVVHQLLDFTQK